MLLFRSGRLAAVIAMAGVLVATSAATAQFKPGVIGNRGSRWADSPRGVAIQVAVVVLLTTLTLGVVTAGRLRRRKTGAPPVEDSGASGQPPEFWGGPPSGTAL